LQPVRRHDQKGYRRELKRPGAADEADALGEGGGDELFEQGGVGWRGAGNRGRSALAGALGAAGGVAEDARRVALASALRAGPVARGGTTGGGTAIGSGHAAASRGGAGRSRPAAGSLRQAAARARAQRAGREERGGPLAVACRR